jgi:hypothetical protein
MTESKKSKDNQNIPCDCEYYKKPMTSQESNGKKPPPPTHILIREGSFIQRCSKCGKRKIK